MKRILISSIIFSILILTAGACIPAPTVTSQTLSPSSTDIPTAESTSTPVESQMPSVVKEKFDKAGVDLANMANAKYDKDGLHITLESGEITITNAELEKRIYNSQENVLQYRDEDNKKVVVAFDKTTNKFLEASKYVNLDAKKLEAYIVVENWDDVRAVWAKEKLFLIPFDANNTYFPPSDKIKRDYDETNNPQYGQEFSASSPFGILPEGTNSPFKPANYMLMRSSTESGVTLISYLVTEQVFNPDDGTYSVLHFMKGSYNAAIRDIQDALSDKTFMLPRSFFIKERLQIDSYIPFLTYYRENNLIDSQGRSKKVEDLINKWFDSRHVPVGLEKIPLDYQMEYITLSTVLPQ